MTQETFTLSSRPRGSVAVLNNRERPRSAVRSTEVFPERQAKKKTNLRRCKLGEFVRVEKVSVDTVTGDFCRAGRTPIGSRPTTTAAAFEKRASFSPVVVHERER